MVIRDASNAGWVRLDPRSDESYFGDMFLKPHPRKRDGGLIFSIPSNMKPPVFGLVFNASLWKKVEEFREAEVCSDLTHALMFRLLLFWQIYNGRSLSSPDTGELPPMAELQAGYSAHTKRKAGALNSTKGPRKVPRRDSQSPKTQKVYADSSSDDEAIVPLRLPVDEGANSACGFDNDGDFVHVSQKEEQKNADNNDQEERGHTGDKLRSTTTVATRGRVADSNLKLPLARQVQVASTSTVSTMRKPFTIPIDFESIRKGFLEGGVKSTDGKSTSSTSHKLQHLIKDSHLLGTFRSIHLRAHHLPQPTPAHLCGANHQTQQAEARYAGPRRRNI